MTDTPPTASRHHPRLRLHLAAASVGAWLMTALALAAVAQAPATAPVPRYAVSIVILGPGDVGSSFGSAEFVGRLDARDTCDAVMAPREARRRVSWHSAPPSVEKAEWLSVAVTVFGRRQNWLALRFDPADGSVQAAAWRPAVAQTDKTKYSYINSIPPGPDTNENLAGIELASEIGRALAEPRATPGPLVQVRVEQTESARTEPTLDLEAPSDALGGPGASFEQDLSPEQIEALRAMALVAAWQTGLRPTLETAANQLVFKVTRQGNGFVVQVHLTLEGKTQQTPARPLPDDLLYPGLRAMVRWARDWPDAVVDIVQLDPWPVQPLLFDHDRIIFRLRDPALPYTLRLVSLKDMLPVWTLEAGERETPQYTVLPGPDGPRLYTWQEIVQPRSLETGAATSTTRLYAPTHPWGFTLLDDKTELVARGSDLMRAVHGSSEWTVSFADAVHAGPLLHGDLVVAAAQNGDLRAVKVADGSLAWQTEVPVHAWGPILELAGGLLVTSERGEMRWLQRQADGSIKTATYDFADAVIGPMLLHQTSCVAVGADQIWRVDAVAGTVLQRVALPELPASATPITLPDGRMLLAVVDVAGTVRFYDGLTLELKREVALGVRALHQPLYIADAPHRWGMAGLLVDRGPVLMVPAEDAVCYILEVPE